MFAFKEKRKESWRERDTDKGRELYKINFVYVNIFKCKKENICKHIFAKIKEK